MALKLQDFAKLLRARWLIVCVTLAASIVVAVVVTAMTTPLYRASTRLFVSTESGSSLAEAYQGNRFSQERVKSYAELIKGQTVAQRTIDKLGLDMSATELQGKVIAKRETRHRPDKRVGFGRVARTSTAISRTRYPTSSSSWFGSWKHPKPEPPPTLASL